MHQEEVCTESQRERITVLQTGDLWHGFYLFRHKIHWPGFPLPQGSAFIYRRLHMCWHEDFAAAFPLLFLGIMWLSHLALRWKFTSHCQVHMNELLFWEQQKKKKNPLNKLLNFFCWTILQVAGANAFTKLADCKCGACFACTTNELKWGSRIEIQFHPCSLPFPVPEPSPLQHLPFRIPILYSSTESVHCLISKCIGEVIYDSHYYNRLAAPKRVKIATIISPTFPSLAPHRRKSLINPVGVTHALVCFYNLQREFDIFWKWWCLQTSYSLQKYISSF